MKVEYGHSIVVSLQILQEMPRAGVCTSCGMSKIIAFNMQGRSNVDSYRYDLTKSYILLFRGQVPLSSADYLLASASSSECTLIFLCHCIEVKLKYRQVCSRLYSQIQYG